MAGVLYSAEWDCGKCALRLRGFFKEKDVLGAHFVDHRLIARDAGKHRKTW